MNVPDRPSGLGIEIQGDSWREGQREAIARIAETFQRKRFVLASMPTGSGKTIVSTAVQRLLGYRATNLTQTRQLQRQYLETMPWATVCTGRRNHICELDPFRQVRADEAPCAHGWDGCDYQRPDGCSYYRMLFQAADNPQTVLNYAYATRILQVPKLKFMRGGNPFRRDLLVCDEGDLAEGAVVEAAGIPMTERTWGRDLPESDEIPEWIAWAELRYDEAEEEVREAADVMARSKRETGVVDHTLLRRHSSALRKQQALGRIAGLASHEDEWIVVSDASGYRIRPLWGWSVAHSQLWGGFKQVLLMSATLGDPRILIHKLGIPKEEAEYVEIPSTFPKENRLVFYWPVVKMNREAGDGEYERLASAIDYVANQPAMRERKGIIHTGSFRVARKLWEKLGKGRYTLHGSLDNREEVLSAFRSTITPNAILSPSFTHGVDIPYQIGWQVIAKVPFGDLGDPVVKARREYGTQEDPKFGRRNYDAEAMNTVIQACGRAVRAPDDQGVTYILDANYYPLHKRVFKPKFYEEAFLWVK